ncbi:MAG: ribonuclease III [Brevinema sp.]
MQSVTPLDLAGIMRPFFSEKSELQKTDLERYKQLKNFCRLRKLPIKNMDLLDMALTHVSCGARCYERLEFLGDSVMGLCLASMLYQNYPDLTEGKMSALKATLAEEKSFAQVARELDLLAYVRLGRGERLQDERAQEKVLCDLFESLISVLYLDCGFETCQKFVHPYFIHKIGQVNQTGIPDYKTRLQKISVRTYRTYPCYSIMHTEGPDHGKIFNIKCTLEDFVSMAKGRSKKEAEQACAQIILESIRVYSEEHPDTLLAKEYCNEK